MATVERVGTNGQDERATQAFNKAVGAGQWHSGIQVGQSPPGPPVAEHPSLTKVEATTVSQSPPRVHAEAGATGAAAGVSTPAAASNTGLGPVRLGGSPMSGVGSPHRPPSSLTDGSPLRGAARSPHAAGPVTFGNKYVPFASGFYHMSEAAPVYRATRLTTINPTAAETDDLSFYYTLDSGRTEPGAMGEHVRNTRAAAQSSTGKGGFFSRLGKPIE